MLMMDENNDTNFELALMDELQSLVAMPSYNLFRSVQPHQVTAAIQLFLVFTS